MGRGFDFLCLWLMFPFLAAAIGSRVAPRPASGARGV